MLHLPPLHATKAHNTLLPILIDAHGQRSTLFAELATWSQLFAQAHINYVGVTQWFYGRGVAAFRSSACAYQGVAQWFYGRGKHFARTLTIKHPKSCDNDHSRKRVYRQQKQVGFP